MLRAFPILAMLLSTAAVSGQPTWITMQNENFRAYSTASERATREALNQFERVRGLFIQLTGAKPAKAEPVTVVIFGSEKDYQPYRLKSFAAAYYVNIDDRDFIVVGELGDESSHITTHEYTHLVFKHAGFSLPPWLNEGLAELFSTLRAHGNDTEFGEVLVGRLQALNSDPWVPLATIVAADRNSPYYNETRQAGSLYNEGWAFVHMLATTDKYRSRFWTLLKPVNSGTPSVQALEATYGVPLAKLEEDLQSYIQGSAFFRGNAFSKLRVKIKLDETAGLGGQPADMFDVRTTLARLLTVLPSRQAEARTRLEELTHENAGRPEPWASLGYLAMRDGNPAEAENDFAKAFDRGGRGPGMLRDYARLTRGDRPEASAAALTAWIVVEPENVDARLTLADLQISQEQYSEALSTLAPVTTVHSEDQRDKLLYLRAFAYLQQGDSAKARAFAEELKSASSSQDMQSRADDILRIANRK
jgi:hypothetical protein